MLSNEIKHSFLRLLKLCSKQFNTEHQILIQGCVKCRISFCNPFHKRTVSLWVSSLDKSWINLSESTLVLVRYLCLLLKYLPHLVMYTLYLTTLGFNLCPESGIGVVVRKIHSYYAEHPDCEDNSDTNSNNLFHIFYNC